MLSPLCCQSLPYDDRHRGDDNHHRHDDDGHDVVVPVDAAE